MKHRSMDQLREEVRAIAPLVVRLERCQTLVGAIASGRDMRMTVPPLSSDDDIFLSVTLSDAVEELERTAGVTTGAMPQPLPKRLPTVTAALSMCREANSEARIPVPMAWDVALYVTALERALGVAPSDGGQQ
jgi:hypothetical protein